MQTSKSSHKAIFTQILTAVKGELSVFFGFSFAAFLCCAFTVLTEGEIEASLRLAAAFPIALLAILIATQLTQQKQINHPRLVQFATGLISLVIGIVLTLNLFEYELLAYFGALCALVAMTVFAFYPSESGEKSENYLANLFKHFLLSVFISGLLFLGLLFLLGAYQFLFGLDGNFFWKFVLIIACFCACLIFTNFFSYFLFYKGETPSTKLTKVVFVYMLFPIFVFLLLLLYAYFAVNIIGNTFSGINVNWFISFASLAFILFFSLLQGYTKNKAVSLFYKIGAFVIMPLIVLQIIAVAIRISAYGLTPKRVASIYYIVFSVVAIALTQVKKAKHYRFALVVLAGLFVLATFGPLNIYATSFNSQRSRLENILYKYGLFDGNDSTFTPESLQSFSAEDKAAFVSAARLISSLTFRGKTPDYLTRIDNLYDFLYIQNYEEEKIKRGSFTVSLTNIPLDISSYSTFSDFNSDSYGEEQKRILIEFAGKQYDVTDFITSLEEDDTTTVLSNDEYDVEIDDYKKLFVRIDDADFYFSHINYSYDLENEVFLYYYIHVYAFK